MPPQFPDSASLRALRAWYTGLSSREAVERYCPQALEAGRRHALRMAACDGRSPNSHFTGIETTSPGRSGVRRESAPVIARPQSKRWTS